MSLLSSLRRRIRGLRWLVHPRGLRERIDEIESLLRDLRSEVTAFQRIEMSRAWVAGHRMRVDPDDTVVGRWLREVGWFEPTETRLIHRLVKPGDTVVDVGANIGYYTLQLARLVGPAGRVFAFEPEPRNFDLLRRNVWENDYDNVTLVQAAVAARPERLRLYLNPENRGDHRLQETAGREAVEVEGISLDDYFRGSAGRLDLVKIDVQGAEGSAFEGMRGLVAAGRVSRIITEFWPRGLSQAGCDPRDFLECCIREGFRVREIDEQRGRLVPLDVSALLDRLPAGPDTDLLFTNLLLEHRSVDAIESDPRAVA
jgi:FkbM family methyltransferase